MTNLFNYLVDGAGMQESCIMAYLRNNEDSILSESYNKEKNNYDAQVEITRYYNWREQGYTICLSYDYCPLIYITFFEHRNSDDICLLINEDKNFGECPTPNDVWGDRKGKFDYDKSFKYMEIEECGDYIIDVCQKKLHKFLEEKKKK